MPGSTRPTLMVSRATTTKMSSSTATSSRMAGRHGVDRHEVGDAVEDEHEQHGAGELQMQRLGEQRQALPMPVLHHAPRVEGGAGVGEGEAEQHRRQAELLEAEDRRQQPHTGGEQAEHDGAARRAIRALRIGQVAAQQPGGDVRHADADEVGEVRRRDHPYGVAHDEEDDCRTGGEQGRRPRAVGALEAQGKKARQQSVVGELRHGARGARQRLHRAVEHVEHDEPDRRRLAEAAEQRREGRTEHGGQILAELLGAEHAQPDDRQRDEVDAGHAGRRQHGARHVAWLGSLVSPTWQAAASKAGAANPIRYRPAITEVRSPNQPLKGVVRS